ncbi:HlyD family secretion protein [Bradyrhizobium sp. ISRA443]|uniref:HlyD family efflux transporter periplasmic adaptor subunit n=1 Tax=unclassified Bradyrhizobium TaxID=2631580 RepID=UPI0024787AFF|nr:MULTISPECIES: HlyD family secretion protein [unclassified Bradyrhizobium]WGR94615.1 HlyD family secretion protein [Bradyrhizobium sp. ISRA435]WGR99394.1 HlyD family secretion protein [Bradyrhizobium sp. ISRA436]WGS06285.1 HlyD family secretion protein [Bradyrhizobium sp. ISRA437]WGS13169.1 HlyD family secretion protein [Bradyrhizobium sp. ISRA443]
MIRRGTKMVFGIGMLGLGSWTMFSTYSASEGATAVVNGKVAVIRAPKDGYVSFGSLHRGSAVEKGEPIGRFAVSLSPAHDTSGPKTVAQARGRVQAIAAEIDGLQNQYDQLRREADEYRDARLRQLNIKLSEAKAAAEASRAKEHSTATIVSRQRREFARGFALKDTVTAAEQAANAARFDREAADKKLDSLNVEVAAAKNGTYLTDGYNNSSYSQQRADQVALRITELKAESQQQESLIASLNGDNRSLRPTDAGADSAVEADLASPVSGLLWSISAESGQFVRAGDELARVIDCKQLFASIAVSQRGYGAIREGEPASFHSEGQPVAWHGTVVWAGVADREFGTRVQAALDPPTPSDARYNLMVALDSDRHAGEQCPVGKPGRVTFDSENTWARTASDLGRTASEWGKTARATLVELQDRFVNH